MISIICFCVFGVILTAQAQVGNDLFDAVENLKNHVSFISNDLANFEKNLTFSHYVELSHRKIQHYENINHSMTATLMELKNATIAVTVEGHDITQCYESAEKYLTNESQMTFRKLDLCMRSQWHLMNPLLVRIQNHVQEETSILQNLNAIVLDCSSGTNVQVASCVEWEVQEAKLNVELYESPVKKYKDLGGFLIYSSVINYFRCADPFMNNFYDELRVAKQTFNECFGDVK